MHVTKAVVEGTKNEVLELIQPGLERDLGICKYKFDRG